MKIQEFNQLRQVLSPFYLRDDTQIVGYLRGSDSPAVWRSMENTGRAQMKILGNQEPTAAQWDAAGVGHRSGATSAIKFPDLQGFIILYGGFMVDRPWGKIFVESRDASEIGFRGTLEHFEREVRSYLKLRT